MSSVSSLNSLLSSSDTTSSSSIDLSSLLTAATDSTSTGIDVTSAVSAAIYAAQAPERQWQTEQATAKSQITALTGIQTALSTVTTDLDSLNNLSGPLTARTVSSTASSVVSATATDGAAVGSHVVTVTSLATSATWYSPSLTSATSALGNTTLQIVGANGTTSSYTTGSGVDTLNQLVSAINAGSSGVTASVVSDSSGSRLSLVSAATGAANNFTVSYGAVSGTSWSSADVTSSSTALIAGSFQIGDGTTSQTINVTAGQTLSDVANTVNNAGLNVTASVVTDSTGAHLALVPSSSSTGSSVTVTGDPTLTGTQPTSASDAVLSVDGAPIKSASNSVTAISGLTINLLSPTTYTNADGSTTTGTVTLGVAADSTQMTSAISQFVTDYNSALSLVNTQFTYGSSGQGVLSANSDLRSLQSTLLGIASYTGTTAATSSSSSTTTSLATLGITMGDDGSLTLDTTTLNNAITSNPATVQNFFQGTALNGFAQTFETSLDGYTNASTGSIALGINNLNTTYTNLQSQVDDYESGYIASQKTVLTAMYSQAEIALESLPTTLKQLQSELTTTSS